MKLSLLSTDRGKLSVGDISKAIEMLLTNLRDEGWPKFPMTLHSSDFRSKDGPFFIYFKTKEQALAWLDATSGKLEVDLSATDATRATIQIKMLIDTGTKDNITAAIVDESGGHLGEVLINKITNAPQMVNIVETQHNERHDPPDKADQRRQRHQELVQVVLQGGAGA